MRKVYLLVCLFVFAIVANAQPLTGVKNIPGDYPSLDSFIKALNLAGVGSGGVTGNLLSGNPQTAPAGGYKITASGNAGGGISLIGNNNLISANSTLSSGNLNDGIFIVDGADFLTLQGFFLSENPANTTTNPATNNMTEFGIGIFHASPTNGAKNITIQGNNISLNRTYANAIGIYSTNRSNYVNVTTVNDITSISGSNENLLVRANTISDVNLGIIAIGSNSDAFMLRGVTIGGNTPGDGNTITNFGSTGVISAYPNVGNTVAGVIVDNSKNDQISNNTVTSFNGAATAHPVAGIVKRGSGTLMLSGSETYTGQITSNALSLRNASPSSAITGISNEIGNANYSINISNNNFHTTTHTVGSNGNINFIQNIASVQNVTISGNTFNNLIVNTNGSINFISNNIPKLANGSVVVNNNSIVGTFQKSASGGNVAFYFANSVSPNTATEINIGNNFSNVSLFSTTALLGWWVNDGTSSAGHGSTKNVSNNVFNNITGGTGALTILNVGFSNSLTHASIVNNNTISNISNAGPITGITVAQGSHTVSNNRIFNFNTTGSGTSSGIILNAGVIQTFSANKIYDITGSNIGSSVYGFSITNAASTTNLVNNIIARLFTPNVSNADAIRGISVGSSNFGNINVLHNTIHLSGTSTGSNFGSAGIYHASSSTAAASKLKVNNNIVVNTCTRTGSGRIMALRRSSTVLNANWDETSNNNLLYAGTPGPGNIIYGDVSNSMQTLFAFQTSVYPRESNSVTENPPFLNIVGGSGADFLVVDPTVATQVEKHGLAGTGVTQDFSGSGRDVLFPDLGAHEGNNTLLDKSGPEVTITSLPNTCNTGNRTFVAQVKDLSGVPTSGSDVMKVYYSKDNGVTWHETDGNLQSGNAFNGNWNFTIDVSLMGGVSPGNEIDFFVLGQDLISPANVRSAPFGAIATNVNTLTSAPPNPSSYNIANTLNGTYTIGSGQNFPSITSAFNAYNGGCLTGPVVFELRDANYNTASGETFPLTINNHPDASASNTLFIKPGDGINTNISGTNSTPAVIKLFGTRFVTIDGRNTAGSSLTVTNTNTGNSAGIWVAKPVGAPPASANITLKNLTINGGSSTNTSHFGINIGLDGSTPSSALGHPDDNMTVDQINFRRCYYAILAFGSTASGTGAIDQLIIKNNILGPAVAGADNLGFVGFSGQNILNLEVSGNTFQNIQTSAQGGGGVVLSNVNSFDLMSNLMFDFTSTASSSGNSAIAGINLGINVANGSISKNRIFKIRNTNTGGYGARGINVNTGNTAANVIVSNNQVTDVRSFCDQLPQYWPIGIAVEGNSNGIGLYNNSVNLFGAQAGFNTVNGGSAAFFFNSIPSGIQFINNIAVNSFDNTNSSTDKSYAIYSSAFSSSQFTAIDFNNFKVSGPAGLHLGRINNIDRPNLVELRNGFGGNINSLSVVPNFLDAATNLNLNSIGNGLLNRSGSPLASVPADIDGDPRHPTTPDIGSDEFLGPLTNDVGVIKLVTPATGNCFTNTQQITLRIRNFSESILDLSVTPVTVTVNATGPGSPLNNIKVVNSGTIPIAGDWDVTLDITMDMSLPGTYVFNANAQTTGETDPSNNAIQPTQVINTTIPATITVGAGGTYSNMYLFRDAYQAATCFPDNIVVNLLGNQTISGTPVTFNPNPYQGNKTVTIQPATGTNVTISGNNTESLIDFFGIDNYIIDGLNTGGASLTFHQQNPIPDAAGIIVSSASSSDGATNNIFRNLKFHGNSPTTTGAGIGFGSQFFFGNPAEGPNANNTVHGCEFTNSRQGIVVAGNPVMLDENFFAFDNTFRGGIYVAAGFDGTPIEISNARNAKVEKNTISDVSTTTPATIAAIIYRGIIEGGFINRNIISKINNLNAGGYGALGIKYAPSTPASPATSINNNFIFDITGIGFNGTTEEDNGYGIYLANGGVNIDFNTVRLNTNQSNTGGWPAALNLGSTVTGTVNIRNNIFYNSQTVGTNRLSLINNAPNTVFGTFDFNNFFSNAPIAFTGGVFVGDIAGLQTAIPGQNTNSQKTALTFTSAADPHLSLPADNTMVGAGTPVINITNDIDDDPRANPPALGADEPGGCVPVVIEDGPGSMTVCAGGFTSLMVFAEGTPPINYQWYRGYPGDISNPVGTNSFSLFLNDIQSNSAYWVKVTNSCGQESSDTAFITVTTSTTFTGAVNSSWDNPGNWSNGCVPNENVDAIIPEGKLVTVDSEVDTRNLVLGINSTIELHSTFTFFTGGHMDIEGEIRSINPASKVVMNGTEDQNITGNGKIDKLTVIKGDGSVSITSGITIGTLSGTTGVINVMPGATPKIGN